MDIDYTQLEVWQLRYYDENPSRGGAMIPYKTFVTREAIRAFCFRDITDVDCQWAESQIPAYAEVKLVVMEIA